MKDILLPLRKLHGNIYEFRKRRKEALTIAKKFKTVGKDVVFFVLSPTHGNLGDHAIAEAAQKMLIVLRIPFIEVTTRQLGLLDAHKKLGVMNGRMIIVNGGGNLGTLWFDVEMQFRHLIKENPKSKIFCLPNTIYYERTGWGDAELKKSEEIYNSHMGLRIYAREKASYDFMKNIYRDVVLVPDMVLSMDKSRQQSVRKGCLLCLRNDLEKTRTEQQEKEIRRVAGGIFGDDVCDTDMCVDHMILPQNRADELNSKYEQFKHAQLVITDRLHGMIFAAITGTPCVVINSKSPKVKGCYEWLKRLDYIKFAESADEVGDLYMQIPNRIYQYDNRELQPYYAQLKTDLLKAMEK